MNTFFEIDENIIINVGQVRKMEICGTKSVRVTFNDGSYETYSIYSTVRDAEKVMDNFQKTIIQIVLCTEPIYNVYNNGDGTYSHSPVRYLALCVDGIVRSLDNWYGPMKLAEETCNFTGYFPKDNLYRLPSGELRKEKSKTGR